MGEVVSLMEGLEDSECAASVDGAVELLFIAVC